MPQPRNDIITLASYDRHEMGDFNLGPIWCNNIVISLSHPLTKGNCFSCRWNRSAWYKNQRCNFNFWRGVALTSEQQENARRHRFESRLKLVGCSGLTSLLTCFFPSVIWRQCLVARGSSMLTFIVPPHWSFMPWYQITVSIPTLGWSVLTLPLSLSAKRGAASSILMTLVCRGPGSTQCPPVPRSGNPTDSATEADLVWRNWQQGQTFFKGIDWVGRYSCGTIPGHLQWYIVRVRDPGLGLHGRFRAC